MKIKSLKVVWFKQTKLLTGCRVAYGWKGRFCKVANSRNKWKTKTKTNAQNLSFEPELNQRPKDYFLETAYSPPLYQLSYRRKMKKECQEWVKTVSTIALGSNGLPYVLLFTTANQHPKKGTKLTFLQDCISVTKLPVFCQIVHSSCKIVGGGSIKVGVPVMTHMKSVYGLTKKLAHSLVTLPHFLRWAKRRGWTPLRTIPVDSSPAKSNNKIANKSVNTLPGSFYSKRIGTEGKDGKE